MPRDGGINHEKWNRVERVTKTADFDGADIDRLGYAESLITVDVQEAGTAGGALDADNKWELKLYHADDSGSDTAGTYAVVPAAQLVHKQTHAATFAETTTGSFAVIDAATEDEQAYHVAYIGVKRWLRVRYEATGSPGSTIFSTFHRQSGGVIPAV